MSCNKNTKKEIIKWLEKNRISNPINVTFTEKQYLHKTVGKDKRIFKLDEFKSSQNLRHFKNVLNRSVFGNGYQRFNKQLQMLVVREVSPQTQRHHLHLIIEQPLRYNFNEFRNLIERIAILSPGNDEEKILDIIKESLSKSNNETFSVAENLSIPLREARENFEKEYLISQIKKFGGNISKTAKFVGMERSALHRKLKLLGVKDLN